MKVIDPSVKLLSPSTAVEATELLRRVEYAGRNCYRTHDKITEDSWIGFTERLAKRGHTAPLEFASVMLEIVTGRDVMAEITRHRFPSFCVQSHPWCPKTGRYA